MGCQAAAETFGQAVKDLEGKGTITSDQAKAILDAFSGIKSDPWPAILQVLGSVAGSLGLVRFWRGGIGNRKGKQPGV